MADTDWNQTVKASLTLSIPVNSCIILHLGSHVQSSIGYKGMRQRGCRASSGRWGQGEWRGEAVSAVPLTAVSFLPELPDSYACLSFPNSSRHSLSLSLSPDRSLGLGLWRSLAHQMLIGHSGRLWEPENELLTDQIMARPGPYIRQQKEEEAEGQCNRGRVVCFFDTHQ